MKIFKETHSLRSLNDVNSKYQTSLVTKNYSSHPLYFLEIRIVNSLCIILGIIPNYRLLPRLIVKYFT